MTDPDSASDTLLDVLHCTPDDLAANRRGQLSARQCTLLPDLAREQQFDARREALCSALMLGGCTSFFAFAGVAGLIDAVQRDAIGVRLLGIPVSVLVLLGVLIGYRYVLRSLWWAVRHTEPGRDLRADLSVRIVRRVTGDVAYHDDRYQESGALDTLHIGDESFEFHDALRAALPEGAHVTAYYTPYRRVLVAIEPADPAED